MKIITFSDLNKDEINNAFFAAIDYQSLPEIDGIINSVKIGGNKSLIEISNQFSDGNFSCPDDFLVSQNEIEAAYARVSKDFITNITFAKNNVLEFAKKQMDTISEFKFEIEGSTIGHKIVPLRKTLSYVPGGNYPLPSSCVMTTVPAKVAGVKEVCLTSPKIKDETIVAAHISGADKIYKLGGAQAVSAFAYGTETIEPVDKIVGPGNRYVTYAKKYVFGTVDIDFLAGPSEVLIIADETADSSLVAVDMLAQCEHDIDARAYLITNSLEFANSVLKKADEFLSKLKTSNIAKVSFSKSFCVIVDKIQDACEISNKRAPEHLEIMTKDDNGLIPLLTNFGSLFIGKNCAEVFGDYVTGTNHVLPTNFASKYTGGLSVFDFIKILTYQNISEKYAKILSPVSSFIAQSEGLFAHKLAADLRSKQNNV